MQHLLFLFREEYRAPRLLTWPLVFLGAGAVAWADGRDHYLLPFFSLAGALGTIVLLEFAAVGIEVTETEVRFLVSPFYRRRIAVADIHRLEVRAFAPATGAVLVRSWRPAKYGVELAMEDGSLLTLFTQHPEHLAHAINRARAMARGHEVPSTIEHHS